MGSERLPGKVLRPIAGRPVLGYLLDRLERATSLDLVVVATSTDTADDPIATFCAAEGVTCHRGPLENVAVRFAEIVDRYGLDAFVRVSADSPLLDQRLVDRAVELFRRSDCAIATNVRPRSFPRGQSVEVVAAQAFLRALPSISDASDLEHVTSFLYRHPDLATIRNFSAPEDFSAISLAIDTEADLATIAAMLGRMEAPHWEYSWEELVRLYRAVS